MGLGVQHPPPDPEAGAAVEVFADVDGATAAAEAVARGGAHRTAVWVGTAEDHELDEFRAEIGRAR
jgi:hypothetical protein